MFALPSAARTPNAIRPLRLAGCCPAGLDAAAVADGDGTGDVGAVAEGCGETGDVGVAVVDGDETADAAADGLLAVLSGRTDGVWGAPLEQAASAIATTEMNTAALRPIIPGLLVE